MAKGSGQHDSKRGRLSGDEKNRIDELFAQELPLEEVARRIGRAPGQVKDYAVKFLGKGDDKLPAEAVENSEFIRHFRSRPDYKALKASFTHEELNLYETTYAELMVQFKEDIRKTEDILILQLCDCQIFMNRHKVSRFNSESQILILNREIMELQSRNELDSEEKMRLEALRGQSAFLDDQLLKKARDYNEQSKTQQELMKKLKGTREQRMKNNESKTGYTDLIRFLLEPSNRLKAGREAALRRKAMELKEQELANPIKYLDGQVDQPLLNAYNYTPNGDEDDNATTLEIEDRSSAS